MNKNREMIPVGIFGTALDEAITKNKMSKAEFAEKLRQTSENVRKYIIGKHVPPLGTLERICEILGLNFEYMSTLRSDYIFVKDVGLEQIVKMSPAKLDSLKEMAKSLMKKKKQA